MENRAEVVCHIKNRIHQLSKCSGECCAEKVINYKKVLANIEKENDDYTMAKLIRDGLAMVVAIVLFGVLFCVLGG